MSKEDSKILYGVAILIMVFHHIFMNPSKLGITCTNFIHMCGWFGKICVAIYAYISGYGLMVSFNENRNATLRKNNIILDYKNIAGRIINFYLRYWVVFFATIPLYLVLSKREIRFSEILMNFFGISFSYNGAWWYVKQYIVMLLLFPVLRYLCIKISNIKKYLPEILLFATILLMFIMYYSGNPFFYRIADSVLITYIVIFIEGMIAQNSYLYNSMFSIIQKNRAIACLVFCLCVVIRVITSNGPAYCLVDIVIIAPFSISICVLARNMNLKTILGYIGKYSIFMWLTHCFYIKGVVSFVQDKLFGSNALIYFIVLGCSFLTSICLKKVSDGIKLILRRGGSTKKV